MCAEPLLQSPADSFWLAAGHSIAFCSFVYATLCAMLDATDYLQHACGLPRRDDGARR